MARIKTQRDQYIIYHWICLFNMAVGGKDVAWSVAPGSVLHNHLDPKTRIMTNHVSETRENINWCLVGQRCVAKSIRHIKEHRYERGGAENAGRGTDRWRRQTVIVSCIMNAANVKKSIGVGLPAFTQATQCDENERNTLEKHLQATFKQKTRG